MIGEAIGHHRQKDAHIWQVYLEDSRNRAMLIDPRQQKVVIESAKLELNKLTDAQMNKFAFKMIRNLGEDKVCENKYDKDVDKRDGSLVLLGILPFEKLDKGGLVSEYVRAVKRQSRRSDSLGSIYSLLEGGKLLAEKLELKDAEKSVIKEVWYEVEKKFNGTKNVQWNEIKSEVDEFREILENPQKEQIIFDNNKEPRIA